MTNFATQLSAAAADDGDRPAIKLDDIVLDYQALDAGVARAAGLLRSKGVEPGDRVGMQLPNVPYFPIVYYGALRLGAVVVPLNPLLKAREVEYHLSDSGSRVMIGWTDFADPALTGADAAGAEAIIVVPGEFEQLLGSADAVGDVADREDDDPAVIIYTSGTTGTPKGATLTHANIHAGAEGRRRARRRDAREGGAGHAAAVPRVRDERDDERHDRGACTADPGSTFRAGEGARGDPARSRHDVRRRPDDVHRPAPSPERSEYDVSSLELCVVGRRGPAGGGAARRSTRPSAPRCSRATAFRRPAGWRRSTCPTASASRARSASRSAALRSASSTMTTATCPGRARRGPAARPARDEGLLESRGGHRGGHARRLVPHRRCRHRR